ncbi:Uu.00g066550.m01.CDS01 [Anthostomella pinea]|uniref:Uu.00g066550.m01.CDS01 n=1 Tax=Anthostomella pinea TaxID=933095 RepID=A0AAI8YNC1_9PEZI|nr:Uu.00g066550.m01.CDS01 [Anthostomella pinea]
MLPDSLSSSYERYKADSDNVANWLATTARLCGYAPIDCSSAAVTAPTQPTSRLKGKARKLAREASRESVAAETRPSRAYRVQTKEYVPLAQCITTSTKPRIIVPASFGYALQRAIKDRRRHQDWHSKQASNAVLPENQDGHGYFIDVLERVQEILRPKFASGVTPKSTDSQDNPGDRHIANKFASLLLEDTTDALTEDEMIGRPSPGGEVQFVSDLGTKSEEAFTASAYLWMDVHSIRSLIRNLWVAYGDGKIDSVAASVTTNTAIDFVRNLQEDFDTADKDASIQDADVPCLASAHKIVSVLSKFLAVDPSSYVPPAVPAYVEAYDKETNLLPDYQVLMRHFARIQAEHEVIRGLREFIQHKQPTFSLSFAIQVSIDIRHVLRDITRVLDFHEKSHPDKPSGLKDVLELMARWTEKDTVGDIRRGMQADPTSSGHIPEYYLLQSDPFWCGLLLYNFRMVTYEGAIVTENSYPSILATAHLYNCLGLDSALNRQWTDMENVLSAQGINKMFVGDLPTSYQDCAKRHGLAIGMSAVNFARNPRKLRESLLRESVPKRPHNKIRELERVTPVSWVFKARYCDNSGRVGFEPSDVATVLRNNTAGEDGTKGTKATGKTDICKLLVHLVGALHQEVLEATFDYFQMHMTCWDLLRRVDNVLGSRITEWPSLRHDENLLPSLVLFLLADIAQTPRLDRVAEGGLLRDARQVLDEVITQEGALVTTKRNRQLTESFMTRIVGRT